ncbi:hypothetical protein RESH_00947 [Rhodopirellula europaea SH398]|uniref:Uncharacterized protein n=1 Tax=Rhodopirellula europaea SH398 TaxID=1263868 RepID=M5SL50_9BACT|nr:hypothetical protein RESH_00947 [Rhodopirellula europaea SH398]
MRLSFFSIDSPCPFRRLLGIFLRAEHSAQKLKSHRIRSHSACHDMTGLA